MPIDLDETLACRNALRHACDASRRQEAVPRPRPPAASAAEVEAKLARSIGARTAGWVHGLRAKIAGDRVVLYGWTHSFHAVQLAVAGVLEAYRSMNLDVPDAVELDVDVT